MAYDFDRFVNSPNAGYQEKYVVLPKYRVPKVISILLALSILSRYDDLVAAVSIPLFLHRLLPSENRRYACWFVQWA